MFPFYQPCFDLRNPYFSFQNLAPILSYNYFHNLVSFPNIQHVKIESEAQIQEKSLSPDQFIQNEKTENVDLKIRIPPQFEDFQNIDNAQNFYEQSGNNSSSTKKTKSIQKNKDREGKKKIRSEKRDKAYVAKQYPKQEPFINCRYIQKNFQLNIINQIFSFLWSEEKSIKFTRRFLKDSFKVALFYEYTKIVRKFCKRYINKEYLKNLCDYSQNHIAYKMVAKNTQKLDYLSMKDFSQCVRHLIFIYLNQLCPQAILTSKKMRKQIWREHLIKCRLLKDFMFYNLSTEEYEKLLIHSHPQIKVLIEQTSEDNFS